VRTNQFVEDVWDGAPPRSARPALHVQLSQLRRAIGEDRIATEAGGYRMMITDGEVDALRFVALAADGQRLIEGNDFTGASTAPRHRPGPVPRGGAE